MTERGIWMGVLLIAGSVAIACDSGGDGTDESPGATSLTTSTPGETDGEGTSSGGMASGPGSTSGVSGGGDDEESGEPVQPPPVNFDFGNYPDLGNAFCGAPDQVSCDADSDDPWHAIGLNCPGGPQVDGSFSGDAQQIYVHAGNFGSTDTFPPREGEKMVILSSGIASDMIDPNAAAQTTLGGGSLNDLPDPMTRMPVSADPNETCVENPALIGTGDCSNTIEDQYVQGGDANDLAFLRLSAEVPANTFGFSYDLAFFSVEYPVYYGTQYNDMYVAWLESEEWTGNVSFDEFGAPISLNAGFLDFKDAPNDTDCPAPCEAPELAGTALEGHAGTRWLTTTAPVVPGETIEVYFAIFDLADGTLDSAVILDNFQWTCEGGPPITIPG